MKFIVLLGLMATAYTAHAQNATTLESCNGFLNQLKNEALVVAGYFRAPLDYNSTQSSSKINVFYWIKKGTNPSKVPVLLIHGGPGGNSWRYYNQFKKSNYEGDIISIDNRNEGCSNVKNYVDSPDSYRFFRARSIARDLEVLRVKLYGQQRKWRVFGQSRGTTIGHYYLEMFPNSLESLQTHGGAMTTKKSIERYTFDRSHYNARGSERFASKFPESANVLRQAKKFFSENNICMPMNFGLMNLPLAKRPVVCGELITDSISYKLSNFSRWSDINASLVSLLQADGSIDKTKTQDLFQKEIDGNIYVQYMSYIMGTNGMDNGSPSPRNFRAINNDSYLKNALISEGRFVANAVYPAYLSLGLPAFSGGADPMDFNKVKAFLKNYHAKYGKKFPLIIYSSFYDTIVGPELYKEQKEILGQYVDVKFLPNSGHEGWGTEKEIIDTVFR